MSQKDGQEVSIWKHIEDRWPAPTIGGLASFAGVKQEMESFLVARSVVPYAFSHFGVIVNDIKSSLAILSRFSGTNFGEAKVTWVEAYAVYVARCIVESKELELIQPMRKESLFYDFLNDGGERLHHVAFLVNDILNCFDRLKAKKVELIDKEPRTGSHGKIVFLSPGLVNRICIELCQKQT